MTIKRPFEMFSELEQLVRSTDNLDYLKGVNDTIRIIRRYVEE